MVRHACQFIFVALKLTHSHFKTNWLAVVKCHEVLELLTVDVLSVILKKG